MMTEQKRPSTVPLITLSLDEYLIATSQVTKERWVVLDATFDALYRLCVNEKAIHQKLEDLHAFCKSPQATKEMMARASMAYHFTIENHILVVMNNYGNTKTSGFTTDDIIGFTLSRKERASFHITYCFVHSEYRRKGLGLTMIHSLCDPRTDTEQVTVDVRPDMGAIRFFAKLGFVPRNNAYTMIFKEAVAHNSTEFLSDPVLAPIRGPNEVIELIHYSTRCHTCKDRGERLKTRHCDKCKTISYCSKECQRQDWPLHKNHCIPVNK